MNKLASAFVGSLIAIMILLNGTLAGATGNYISSVIIHTIGLVGIVIILVVKKTKIRYDNSIPKYAYTAGLIGVMPILFNNIGFSILGVSITLALGMLGQSVTAIIVDHYGLFGMPVVKFNKKKISGLLVILAGMTMMTIY